jgi:hypothetical protein
MKITALKCAVIGSNPVVRIVTDAGIDGYGQIEGGPHPPSVSRRHRLLRLIQRT